ncbi:MAG: hypothetical protein LBE12_02145 [Planctomycetaceae bacterium]|nr:hypothetical protein [Planctomycetaceae bacterium]
MILAEDATQIKNIVASQSNVSDQLLSPQQIAATAIENDFPPATINQNYFKRIDGLQIVVPK